MKRVLSLLIVLLLVVSSVPVTVASAADVIEISTAAQLASIGTNDNYPLSGSYKLTDDINLKDYDAWTPIGSSSAFSGTFEGNGKTISNLSVNTSGNYGGLFGQVSGTIKNLTVSGEVVVSASSSSAVTVYAGIVAGYTSGMATIYSCTASGDVTVNASTSATSSWFSSNAATVYAGGVVGNHASWNVIEISSHKSGTVTATATATSSADANAYAGGIAGASASSITDCYNKGEIIAKATSASGDTSAYAGGLVGSASANILGSLFGSSTKISTSYNTGDVSATGTTANAGAIAGNAGSVTASNCYYLDGCCSVAYGAYSGDTAPSATKLSSTNSKKESSYSGFDFESVWKITALVSTPSHIECDNIITGEVGILGTFEVGQTLTADMSQVEPTSAWDGAISRVKYQWYAGVESDGEIVYNAISGATKDTYTLTSDEQGKYIRLEVKGKRALLSSNSYGGVLVSEATLVAAPVPKGVAVSNTSTGVKVTWNSISGAESYTIYRSTYSEGIFGFGAGYGSFSSVGTSTTNSYIDTTVADGTKYKYKVSVTVNGTESEQSAESIEITASLSASGGDTTATADITATSTSSGIVVDAEKTFGGAYSGVVYGFTPPDSGATKITSSSYYTELFGATNDGYVKVVKSIYSGRSASWGTGTLIEVYNSDSTLAKTYVVVIPGDVDGDSVISTSDLGLVLAESKSSSLPDIQKMAANVYTNMRINVAYGLYNVDTLDLGVLLSQVKTYSEFDFNAIAEKQNSYNSYYQ